MAGAVGVAVAAFVNCNKPPLTGAAAAAGGGVGACEIVVPFLVTSSRSSAAADFDLLAAMIAMSRASPKKMPAAYFVILVSTLPEPAPKSASVAAPPKAMPAPASFLGNCNSINSTSRTQSRNINTVKQI